MLTISKITYQTSDQRSFSRIASDEMTCFCAQNIVFIYNLPESKIKRVCLLLLAGVPGVVSRGSPVFTPTHPPPTDWPVS